MPLNFEFPPASVPPLNVMPVILTADAPESNTRSPTFETMVSTITVLSVAEHAWVEVPSVPVQVTVVAP